MWLLASLIIVTLFDVTVPFVLVVAAVNRVRLVFTLVLFATEVRRMHFTQRADDSDLWCMMKAEV